MKIFESTFKKINYKDILQLDGAFSLAHINYGKSPKFNNVTNKEIVPKFIKKSLLPNKKLKCVLSNLLSFNGTKEHAKKEDKIKLWENYWLEYINVFDKLIYIMPNSITTIYVGRHAIELGLKYLILKSGAKIKFEHNLGKLYEEVYSKYDINESYMEEIGTFCNAFCKYIEGNNDEYFRYPEYKNDYFFAGNNLDIKWLSYNISLVLLKLIHFADLEEHFQ